MASEHRVAAGTYLLQSSRNAIRYWSPYSDVCLPQAVWMLSSEPDECPLLSRLVCLRDQTVAFEDEVC